MPDPSSRPTYTTTQLSNFFTHISLPNAIVQNVRSAAAQPLTSSPEESLIFLATLQKHTLATVPFENLSLHYSTHHTISLDPGHLYRKVVERGHGGYCTELNCFFATVLRSLGYAVCSVGARVSESVAEAEDGEGYFGWSHMVNIVIIDNRKYMLDVGFGSNGPTQPLLLEHDHETAGIFPSRVRLISDNIPDNTDPSQRLWIYQNRHSPESEWTSSYAFTTLEFLPQDYEIMNFWTSTSPKSWFTYTVVVVKYLLGENAELEGTITLVGGEVKRRIKGQSEVVRECKNEAERVATLEELFGIKLTGDERRGIGRLCTELKGNK